MGLDLVSRPIYVVGAAETPLGKVREHSELSMIAQAAASAATEAGLPLAAVDGVFSFGLGPATAAQIAELLGLDLRYADCSDVGGGQLVAFVAHAAAALDAGLCDVALIAYASRQRTKRSRPTDWQSWTTEDGWLSQFEQPAGLPLAIGHFALAASRHMAMYGTTSEQLAAVAVTAREWARLNPKALHRDELSVADVLDSPMLCDPLHRLDMCLRTDGGAVLLMTRADRARDAAVPPVRLRGVGVSVRSFTSWQMPDLLDWGGSRSSRRAFEMAGIGPADVDVFEPYDASTISVLLQLEQLGFCAPGESGAFVAEGNLAPGGILPSLTSGGGLSYNHPGCLGLQLLVEAVRQVRGSAGARQVPGAEVAVVNGYGGLFWMSATAVLTRD